MRSIMQEEDGTCYICREIYGKFYQQQVEEHHVVFGTADREKSEKYGLKVFLCPEHHRLGHDAAHISKITRRFLEQQAQIIFEAYYPEKSFCRIFGKNYLPVSRHGQGQQMEASPTRCQPGRSVAVWRQENDDRQQAPEGFMQIIDD